jgi:hypothetical protein
VRRLPVAVAVAALVLLVALAMTTGSSASKSLPKPGFAPVTAATLVCPYVNGAPASTTSRAAVADVAGALSPPSHSAGTVTATVLAGPKSTSNQIHPAPAVQLPSVAKAVRNFEVSATGSVAATLAADQVSEAPTSRYRALSGVRCEAPAIDWWFTGADGRVGFTDVLVLANPSPSPAEVSITMWGAKGPVLDTRLQSLRLAPRTTTRIPIASAAPDIASVAVHVHANSGAVTAALADHRAAALQSNGGDFLPATQAPTRTAVIPGFAPGAGPRYLIVTAPGHLDATVHLRLVTRSGSFTPSGISQAVVRAGHSRALSIGQALGGSTGAVELSSDQPVVAEGVSVAPDGPRRPDLMWLGAIKPLTGPGAIADGHDPDGGRTSLYLSAPQGAAKVRLSTPSGRATTISVPAGRSVAVDITNTIKAASGPWPFVVTPLGSAPVYGVRVLTFTGAHGALITGEPLVGLPTPISLPVVQDDPRVAVR